MLDTLQYLQDLPKYDAEQPYELYGYPERDSETLTNCEFETKVVNVTDIREVSGVSIQTHGFEFLQHSSGCDLNSEHFESVNGNKDVLMKYLAETVELVRQRFEAVDVVCFDWRFRRRGPKIDGRIPPRESQDIRHFALPTGDVVHCDYSVVGGSDRLSMQLLQHEIDAIEKQGLRTSIVNVWRPLNDTVKNTPLLLCDRRSVQKSDLIEVDKVLPDKVEKSYFLFHRDYHKWYYMSAQRSSEVAIFRTWMPEVAQAFADCCPHGAGASQTDGWADPRESVEVRLIVTQK